MTSIDPANLVDVPTVPEYMRAFLECREEMSEKHFAMLKAHYHAPGRTVTAGELARAVGYENFNAANLQYGIYASHLCRELGRSPTFFIAVLATFTVGEQQGDEFIRWTMLPQVAEALEQLGWVKRGT